jgi:peptide deformylase
VSVALPFPAGRQGARYDVPSVTNLAPQGNPTSLFEARFLLYCIFPNASYDREGRELGTPPSDYRPPRALFYFTLAAQDSNTASLHPRDCYSARMEIVQDGASVLREKAAPIEAREFGTPELKRLVADMLAALDVQEDGVALAAPQIGVGKRIFVVRYDRMRPSDPGATSEPAETGVYINPEIIKRSRKRAEVDEGCLSVRGTYGKTLRYDRATVRAKDEDGKTFERGGGGVLAQAFQHEIDHLDGILFIDHATDLYEATSHHDA